MRIIQLSINLVYGDGIGNTIILMDRVISRYYETIIATKQLSDNYVEHPRIYIFSNINELDIQSDDIVIYHFGGKDSLGDEIIDIKCKRIVLYQNVTYPFFYNGIDSVVEKHCAEGQRYIRNTVGCFMKAIAPSRFSCNELVSMGWKESDVYDLPLPVFISNKQQCIVNKTEGKRRFLFVGRIVPNKKIEDVIRIFNYYRKNYYNNSYLTIVGSHNNDAYHSALIKYISSNDITNIEFLNHVSDEILEQVYLESDIYLCMSEHEGFCMPLIEAMSYRIPVVAYAATAVPDTMGSAGILVERKESRYVCDKINRLFEDNQYYEEIIRLQSQHVNHYIRNDYEEELINIIEAVNNISEYEYDYSRFEFYKMLIDEIDIRNEELLISQINRMVDTKNGIVIYGMGKAGKKMYNILKRNHIEPKAICDKGRAGEELCGRIILSPSKCVSKYSKSLYIITVQDMTIATKIFDDLVRLGVNKGGIVFCSMQNKRIFI